MPQSLKPYQKAVYLFLFGTLFALIVYRAQIVCMTHDECLSYELIHGNENLTNTANNHYLNTWLMSACSFLFGDSPMSLRLPNVLAFLLYLFYCYRLLSPHPFLVSLFIGFPLLLLNPYMLDFFSMARGYGLSMAFMLGSIYYLFRAGIGNNSFRELMKYLLAGMTMATLGMYANFNLLNFFILVWALFIFKVLYFFYTNKPLLRRRLLYFLSSCLVFGLLLLVAVKRLLFLKDYQQLYHGSDTFRYMVYCLGFSSIDVSSYIEDGLNRVVDFVYYLYAIIAVYTVVSIRRKHWELLQVFFIFSFIMVAIVLEHHLFDALYPLKRTSIYLAPLYGLLVFYFSVSIYSRFKLKFAKVTFNVLSVLFILPIVFNFATRLTPNQVSEQYLEANIKEALDYMLNLESHEKHSSAKIKLAVNWVFLPACRYYVHTLELPVEVFKIESYKDLKADYIYDFHDQLDKRQLKLVKVFVETPTGLYQSLAQQKH